MRSLTGHHRPNHTLNCPPHPTAPASCVATPRPSKLSSTGSDRDAPILSHPYQGPDGPLQKATIESVFGRLQEGGAFTSPSTPQEGYQGAITYQISDRNLVWNDGLKVSLIKRIASQQLGISEEEMDWLVARAAAHSGDIAQRLLLLRQAFPSADLMTMLSNRLNLLLDDDMAEVARSALALRELLPGLNVDAFVADHPLVLDIPTFKTALEDCRRLMPDKDPVLLLRANPDMVLSLVKGKQLLEYDQVANPWS